MTKPPEPSYVAQIRAHSKAPLTRAQIERTILRDWKMEWSMGGRRRGPYGHTYTGHLIAYIAAGFPRLDINKWLRRMASSFEYTRFQNNRKICNLIGSQNSGKTDWFATFALVMLSIDPEYTMVYAASPYLQAAESGMFGRVIKRNSDAAKSGLGHYAYKESKQKIEAMSVPEAGAIELRSLDKVGKLQGKKQPDESGQRGWLILLCDEIEEFPTQDLKDLLDNLQGNVRFFCYTGCNFKSVNGLGGVLCKPEGREFSTLDADADHRWLSERNSVTYRFDGHRSPNILAGKTLYPYLFKEEDRKRLEETHGLTGPKYLEQARSFPFSTLAEFFVLTINDMHSYSAYDKVIWTGPVTRVAFCDAAFGGKDPCVFGICEFGYGRCQDSEGVWHNRQIFSPVTQFMTIKIDSMMKLTPDWANRVAALNKLRKYQFQSLGTPVSPDQQVAVACGEKLREWNIPFSHFGFDGSMRAEFTKEMLIVLGSEVIPLDFGGMPTERPAGPQLLPAKEQFTTFVAEMYFRTGDLVRAGQFRNGHTIDKAIRQMTKRWWRWRSSKKGIQPKNNLGKNDTAANLKSYKDEHGESPDDADTLVGAVEIAIRKGLCLDGMRIKSATDAQAEKAVGGAAALATHLSRLQRPMPRRLHQIR